MSKKIIYILILFIILSNSALCEPQKAYLNYNGYLYSFKQGDEAKFLKNANKNMLLFEKSTNSVNRQFYQQEAMRYYYMTSIINPGLVEAQLGLARLYDEMNIDNFAQKYYFVSLDLDNRNPKTNFYFAQYYYKRGDLVAAIAYYKKAYGYGYSKNYETNYQMGVIYEKLADIKSAIKFYKNALSIKPRNTELVNKIRLLDELNYSESQYYLFGKDVNRKKGSK